MSTYQQQPTGCFICSKQQGEILIPGGAIYEDDLLYAHNYAANWRMRDDTV